MKVLILTSGGDAPGMNMVIAKVYKKFKSKLYACRAGFKGLINNDIIEMKEYKPLEFIKSSGSVIKCSRCDAFKEEQNLKQAIENAKRFDRVVVIGGNGSLKGAEALAKAGITTIYIPSTIDNDVEGCEYSIGFHTAIKACCETFGNIMPSFASHMRVGVFETMGRKCDKLAKAVADMCKPDFLVTNLDDVNYHQMAQTIIDNNALGEASSIIIKENLINLDEFVENLSKFTPKIEIRGVKIGYVQRGHKPTERELALAKLFAKIAIKSIKRGESVKVFAQNGEMKRLKLI